MYWLITYRHGSQEICRADDFYDLHMAYSLDGVASIVRLDGETLKMYGIAVQE